jgi:branched-subunit amino acid aminotransferase/4-amino-4-deoxychorismate lyase
MSMPRYSPMDLSVRASHPLLIGVTGTVGIKPSREYIFLALAKPVGPYFKGGMKPIRLLGEEVIDRVAHGWTHEIELD